MGIGRRVRQMCGPYERLVSDVFRSAFFDLADFARALGTEVQSPLNVLEIGCGDGILTEHLSALYPEATLTGIDICEAPGRLYRGDPRRARFLRISAADLRDAERGRYELVVIADVIHHVPVDERVGILECAGELSSPAGSVVIKEWLREPSAICLASFLIERLITGDRVSYMREPELLALAAQIFGVNSVRRRFRIAPWDCNLALVIEATRGTDPIAAAQSVAAS